MSAVAGATTGTAAPGRSTASYDEYMEREISQQDLHDESEEVMRAVKNGESFIVTCNGEPVARLSPMYDRYFVPSEVVLEAFKDAPHVDYKQFRADLDAIADPSPWRDD